MRFAKKVRAVFAIVGAGLLLLLPASSPCTDEICKELHLKPLHRVCGTVINAAGEPIPRATVTIFRDGSRYSEINTDEKGEFFFEDFKAGNYELQIKAEGFRTYTFPIVVAKPNNKSKRALEIVLTTGYPENCTGVRFVKR